MEKKYWKCIKERNVSRMLFSSNIRLYQFYVGYLFFGGISECLLKNNLLNISQSKIVRCSAQYSLSQVKEEVSQVRICHTTVTFFTLGEVSHVKIISYKL